MMVADIQSAGEALHAHPGSGSGVNDANSQPFLPGSTSEAMV